MDELAETQISHRLSYSGCQLRTKETSRRSSRVYVLLFGQRGCGDQGLCGLLRNVPLPLPQLLSVPYDESSDERLAQLRLSDANA